VPEAPGLAGALAAPQSREGLSGLRTRIEQLREQQGELEERRQQLTNQISEAPAETRAGLVERVQIVDERILQLERQIAATDRAISAAPPELLSETRDEVAALRSRLNDSEDQIPLFFFIGMAVMFVLQRIVGWARRRRGGGRPARGQETASASAMRADDPRLAQLSQSVEAIALEVERIGEGQRFVTQLLAERAEREALPRR
jgi:hypothetical protein